MISLAKVVAIYLAQQAQSILEQEGEPNGLARTIDMAEMMREDFERDVMSELSALKTRDLRKVVQISAK